MIGNRLSEVKKFIHRRRRLLGSVCAALSVLFLFASLQSNTGAAPVTTQLDYQDLQSGFVAVPVTLASSAISSALNVGDTIDLVTADQGGYPKVIAKNVVVLGVPDSGGFSSQSSSVILVSVAEDLGAGLAANTSEDVSFVLRGR